MNKKLENIIPELLLLRLRIFDSIAKTEFKTLGNESGRIPDMGKCNKLFILPMHAGFFAFVRQAATALCGDTGSGSDYFHDLKKSRPTPLMFDN